MKTNSTSINSESLSEFPILLDENTESLEPLNSLNIHPNTLLFNKPFIIKASFTIIFGTFLILNAIFCLVMPKNYDVNCIDDKIMTFTDPLNHFLANNKHIKNIIIIISSLCIDLVSITTALYWLFFSNSWRIMFTFILFYSVRGLIQLTFQFTFPEGYIWEYPGFPSLVVNYEKTNDFFYSGHVGMPFISALEWRKNGYKIPAIICIFICCLEGFTVFITRTHYSIDIIAGIVFAHYFYILSDTFFMKYIDSSWISLKRDTKEVKEI